jgi:hypothetical protein
MEAAEGGEGNVSPEEQGQYDQFMDNAYKLIYSDNSLPKVLERIKSSPNPVEAIAHIAASTVVRLQDSAEKAGSPISPDVMFQGGVEIIEDLADMAGEAGAHDFTDEELESATYQAMDLYQQMASDAGMVDQQAATQDMAALQQADSAGTLEQMVPGLASGNKGAM